MIRKAGSHDEEGNGNLIPFEDDIKGELLPENSRDVNENTLFTSPNSQESKIGPSFTQSIPKLWKRKHNINLNHPSYYSLNITKIC